MLVIYSLEDEQPPDKLPYFPEWFRPFPGTDLHGWLSYSILSTWRRIEKILCYPSVGIIFILILGAHSVNSHPDYVQTTQDD